MNIICKVLGHKWNKDNRFRQECKRKDCLATRYLMWDKLKHLQGKQCVSWQIVDIDNIKIK